jgi:hypothetical protein
MLQGMDALKGPMNKIVRAAEHFKTLETELQTYFQSRPAKMAMEQDNTGDRADVVFKKSLPIPIRIPYIIGDCIQNVRSSLDYLIRELVLAANNQPSDHEMFPICHRPKSFKNAVRRGQVAGISAEAAAIIESLQPYKLGENWEKATLWVLDEFANINKHRRILVTDLHAGVGTFEIENRGGELWARGGFPSVRQNAKVGTYILSTKKVKMDGQIIACVTFDEGPAKGMEVCTVLNGFVQEVCDNVFPRFEKFFA